MIIEVSKNFYKNLLSYNDSKKKSPRFDVVDKKTINYKIYEVLKSDLMINDVMYEDIEWKKIDDVFQGIYLPNPNRVVYFTQILHFNGKPRSRNTYIMQNFSPANKFAKKNNSQVFISINPFDTKKDRPFVQTITKNIIELASNGTFINNSIKYDGTTFENIEDYLKIIKDIKENNSFNDSTFVDYYSDIKKIVIYGRLEGASGCTTLNQCSLISKILNGDYQMFFYNISKIKISKNILKQIEGFGFSIGNLDLNQKKLEEEVLKDELKTSIDDLIDLPRNQETFRANIYKKYTSIKEFNVFECFACKYEITKNLIGAHIYRYADIKKDYANKKITAAQAANLIVSGDNGFLFCPNQDIEFENGMLVFDLNEKRFKPNIKRFNKKDCDNILKNLDSSKFLNISFSDEFIQNIKNHQIRSDYYNTC